MSFIRCAARSVFLPRHAWNVAQSRTRLPRYAGFSTGPALPKDAIESRILNVIKGFEKVDPTKVLFCKDSSQRWHSRAPQVTTSSSFAKDLGLDSLDAVEVVMAVEEVRAYFPSSACLYILPYIPGIWH